MRRRTIVAVALLAILVLFVGGLVIYSARALSRFERAEARPADPPAGRLGRRARPGRDSESPGLPGDEDRGWGRPVLALGRGLGYPAGRRWRGPRGAQRRGRSHHSAPPRRRRGPERRAAPRAAGERGRRHRGEHPPDTPARGAHRSSHRGPRDRGRALLRARRRRSPMKWVRLWTSISESGCAAPYRAHPPHSLRRASNSFARELGIHLQSLAPEADGDAELPISDRASLRRTFDARRLRCSLAH
jgi:hypothetical protein